MLIARQLSALVKLKNFNYSFGSVKRLAKKIIADLQLKTVKEIKHSFSREGITFGYILSQSHLLIHTYPEKKLIHLDLVVCQKGVSEKKFKNALSNFFQQEASFIKLKTFDF